MAAVMSADAGGPDTGPDCLTPPCKTSRGEIRTFVGMNDFYAAPTNGFSSCGYPDLDGENKPGMKQVGGLTIVAPRLGRTPRLNFSAEQRPTNATVVIELAGRAGMRLSVRTWAHATEPLMISEITYHAAAASSTSSDSSSANMDDTLHEPQRLSLRVEAWTVLGCGLGPNPLVEDSFLPVRSGATTTRSNSSSTTTKPRTTPNIIWASRANGFEYQQQPGVYNLTNALVATAVISSDHDFEAQPLGNQVHEP